MECIVSDSRFYMWRALFAMTHADGVVTTEEIDFMRNALETVPFNAVQRDLLCDDMAQVQNIFSLFEKVTEVSDQLEFFNLAHKLVYIDGDYGSDEQAILIKLQEIHNKRTDVDSLVGKIDVQLEIPPKKINKIVMRQEIKGENNLLSILQKLFHKINLAKQQL